MIDINLLRQFDGVTINSLTTKRYGWKHIKGAISGEVIQPFTWTLAEHLKKDMRLKNVIVPSMWEDGDIERVSHFADGVSFGSVHLMNPTKPTKMVQKYLLTNYK
jgi:hypothetical protein